MNEKINEKILVTGGAGLIGSNLVKRLIHEGYAPQNIFVVDNLWRGKKENLLNSNGKSVIDLDKNFFLEDLTNPLVCQKVTKGIDTIYHLADVVAGINFVFGNELFLYHQNILINSLTLRSALENKVKNYIYVGTACSYPKTLQDRLNPPPLKEEDVYPAEPESSYGWSKLMGEYECDLAQKTGKINIGVLRLHNVYGPPCEISPEKSQVIPALCRKAFFASREPFVVWGSGTQKRGFVFIDDVIEALLFVKEKGLNQGVIQIGPAQSVSIREIAEIILELAGQKVDIHFDTSKPEGDKDRMADFSKAKKILNWEPKTDIQSGLKKTYEWVWSYLERV